MKTKFDLYLVATKYGDNVNLSAYTVDPTESDLFNDSVVVAKKDVEIDHEEITMEMFIDLKNKQIKRKITERQAEIDMLSRQLECDQ